MKNIKLTISLFVGYAIVIMSSYSFAEETNKIYQWQIGKFSKHEDQMQEEIKGGLTVETAPKDKAETYRWQMEEFPKHIDQMNLDFTAHEPVTKLVQSNDELFRWQMNAFAKNHPEDPASDTSFKESQNTESSKATK